MNKLLFIIVIFCISFDGYTQSENTRKKYVLQTSNSTFGISSVNLLDNYLSPLPYSGFGVRIAHENMKFRSPDNPALSTISRMKFDIGTTFNPAYTASISFLGGNFAWGMHYHFRPVEHLQILAGGFWDIDFGFKMNLRNVNNPVNLDLAANLNLSAVVIYDIPIFHRKFRFQASFDSPWIGCMFAPALGASYYEIFDLGAKGQFVHFSSFHNKLALRQNYFVEVPFNNSCWRVGLNGDMMKYKANDLVFKKNAFSVFVGYTRILSQFTKKNPAPNNFIGI